MVTLRPVSSVDNKLTNQVADLEARKLSYKTRLLKTVNHFLGVSQKPPVDICSLLLSHLN